MKKIIKLKELEFKNIIENVLLKEQDNTFEKEEALVHYLLENEDEEVGLSNLKKSRYGHYGLELYEVGNKEWAIGTEEEVNKAAAEYIKETAWAFNKDFIIQHSKILDFDEGSERILDAVQAECESGNCAILKLIDNIDEFVEDAIQSDGRGHFLSGYDGEEHEQVINGNYYYIYRIN